MTFKNIIWKYEKKHDNSCSVKIYVRMNNKVRYFQVKGVYVEEKYWDSGRGLVKAKHPLHKTYNSLIRKTRFEIEEHFLTGGDFDSFRYGQKSPPIIELFDKYIGKVEKGEINISEGTLSLFKSTQSRLKQYMEHYSRDLFVNDINEKFQEEFISFMRSKNVSLWTIGLHFDRIKMLIKNEPKHNNTYFNKLPKFGKERGVKTQVYLTAEEIKKIEAVKIKPNLEKYRDRFLICYYFVLRISDSRRISRSSVMILDGQEYLVTISKKTKQRQIAPISNKAKLLLEKYNYSFDFGGNDIANKSVRKIAEIAGIDDPVHTKDGNVVPKHTLVNTHSARRSAATNLRLNGASLRTIADLGGWKDINMLKTYLKASGLDSAKIARDLDHFK